jgi:hypothetical protein
LPGFNSQDYKGRGKEGRKERNKLSMEAEACNPSTWEAVAKGLKVQGQAGPHSETLSQNKKEELGAWLKW